MIAAVHALAGGALGAWLGRPDLALGAGLASHAMLDAIPHTDYRRARYGVADALMGLGIAALLGPSLGTAAMVGAMAGMLPDLEVALQHLGFMRRCLFPSHNGRLPHPQVPPSAGVITQLVTAAVALAALALR